MCYNSWIRIKGFDKCATIYEKVDVLDLDCTLCYKSIDICHLSVINPKRLSIIEYFDMERFVQNNYTTVNKTDSLPTFPPIVNSATFH